VGTKSVYQDGTYLRNNPTWHEEDSPWKARQIEKILEKNNVNASTICEVGCGAGEVLNCLGKFLGANVVLSGYETSSQAFEICKKKERKNLQFFLKNVLDETNIFFDVIMAIDVIEHVDDYLGFLRKLQERAAYKIFHIPLDLSVQTVLRASPIMKVRESVGHIHYFTKDTALATLVYSGYTIVDYFYTGGSLELPNRSLRMKLMKVPRRLSFLINRDVTVRILGGYSLLVLAK
jgi:SAM-dependent methyltransferase